MWFQSLIPKSGTCLLKQRTLSSQSQCSVFYIPGCLGNFWSLFFLSPVSRVIEMEINSRIPICPSPAQDSCSISRVRTAIGMDTQGLPGASQYQGFCLLQWWQLCCHVALDHRCLAPDPFQKENAIRDCCQGTSPLLPWVWNQKTSPCMCLSVHVCISWVNSCRLLDWLTGKS